MAAAYDIIEDDNGDLLIKDGDLVVGASDDQHIFDILDSFTGHWKEFPALGVGIKKYQGAAGQERELARNIKLQLQGDGYSVENPFIETDVNGNMVVDPKAVRK